MSIEKILEILRTSIETKDWDVIKELIETLSYEGESHQDDFKEYQYTANNLDEFIAFSVKIVMQGTNTSEPPLIKDLRAIALAT